MKLRTASGSVLSPGACDTVDQNDSEANILTYIIHIYIYIQTIIDIININCTALINTIYFQIDCLVSSCMMCHQ